jgi:hypothetical protein
MKDSTRRSFRRSTNGVGFVRAVTSACSHILAERPTARSEGCGWRVVGVRSENIRIATESGVQPQGMADDFA